MLLVSGRLCASEPQLRVLTTVKPLQLIAAEITGDAQQVDVLLDPRMSPHDYQLRPSDRSKLERADVIFWVGPALEIFLQPVLSSLPQRIKIVSLQQETAAVGDPHLWMDPLLAAAIGRKMADVLGVLAPTRSEVLHANAARLEEALVAENKRLHQQFENIKSPAGYLVAHDAYGRFEARYNLKHLAALTDMADLPPSAQHIAQINTLLEEGEISCVMREPFAPPRVLLTLLKDRQLRVAIIDSMAADVPLRAGIVEFYRQLGASMQACLER
jgi:zinc transport system substrate-binding protein